MASANDMFQKVGRATATTLSAPGYTTGDSSVNIGSTTNWPTDTGVTFAIDVVDAAGERIAGTYNVFRGRVAGASQVDQVVYEGGDAHRSYPSGATTRVYILVSSYRDNRMVDGILTHSNPDGTLKNNSVTTPAIADDSVTAAKRSGGFKIGVILGATLGSTGNKAVTGLGFKPKLVRFTVLPTASTAAILIGFGAMTETDQFYVTGISSGTFGRNSSTSACIAWVNGGSSTPQLLAGYVSMDSDGFTINVTSSSSTFPVAYEAYA